MKAVNGCCACGKGRGGQGKGGMSVHSMGEMGKDFCPNFLQPFLKNRLQKNKNTNAGDFEDKKSTPTYLQKTQQPIVCIFYYKRKPRNRLFGLSQSDRLVLKRELCHHDSFNVKQALPTKDSCTNLLIARATHTNLHIGATPDVKLIELHLSFYWHEMRLGKMRCLNNLFLSMGTQSGTRRHRSLWQ